MTERKNTEAALRESEARFRSLIEIVADFYWETDSEHRFTVIEANGVAQPEFSAASRLGRTRWEVQSVAPDADGWRAHRAQLEARLPFRHFETAHQTPEGGVRYYMVAGEPFYDAQGVFKGYCGIGREITERKRAEAALSESEERLAATLHSIGDAVLTTDTAGHVTRMNPVAERLTGWPVAEAQGRPADEVFRIVNEQTRAPAVVPVAMVLATGEIQGLASHTVLIARDGTEWPIADSAAPIRDAGGAVSGVVLVFRDVTAERRAEQEMRRLNESLDQANRAKSVFLATMSHEIRTPMNGVLGMLELLGLTKLDSEQRTTLEIVRQSGKSLLRIIDDILDFSKIEAGKLEVRPEVASIKAVIKDVCHIYSGNASSKGLFIRQSLDPQISPAVLVDPLRLKQILNNFVSNAVKFTSQGSIEINAELIERANGEDRVRFSVKDTGLGISAEIQQRLFQPFSQGESDTTRRFGGTGLGLAICRRLAGVMGGSIEMVSELGKGTTMILTLSLPIADPEDLPTIDSQSTQGLLGIANTRRMAPSASQAETEGTLVLVVEDHPTNRSLAARQLNALGYAAESAENGLEALEKWKSGRFGIVITDCNMPEMDGYALARTIRKLESANGAKRTPIIACTANALGGDAEICFAAGMDDYLVKPVVLKQLLIKLDQWLPIPEGVPADKSEANLDTAAAGADAAVPVDRAALAEISGGDAAAERDILTDFRRVNDEDAAMLERAVAEREIPQVKRALHRIKGAGKTVGATGLAGACERIEQASRTNDWTAIEASMGAFHDEWMRLNAYLDSLSGQARGTTNETK